jgi:hypothetical protein
MTHFRTVRVDELPTFNRITKNRIRSGEEGFILVDQRGTVGAIVGLAVVEKLFPDLRIIGRFRFRQLIHESSPIYERDWLSSKGRDLIWLTTSDRCTHVLVHPRHKQRLPIPTFRVEVSA